MKTLIFFTSTIIALTFSQIINAQCTNCENTLDNGVNSSAIGKGTEAMGQASFASGLYSIASGDGATSIGFRNLSSDIYSTTIGSFLQATESHAMVIGDGYGLDNELINNNAYSLMIGFNSTKPTLFISTSDGPLKTGKIGIGNITSPFAKLHLKADIDEEASFLIEPNDWESNEYASLNLGNQFHGLTAYKSLGLKFLSETNFNFEGLNTGFGIEEPKAKVHINGDLLFEQSLNGIIMKSEDGNCWKGTISNTGELIFNQIDCETLSSNNNQIEKRNKDVFIYPNPSYGEITIDYTGDENQIIVEIISINGVLINTLKVDKGETKINLAQIQDQIVIINTYTLNGNWVSTNKTLVMKE